MRSSSSDRSGPGRGRGCVATPSGDGGGDVRPGEDLGGQGEAQEDLEEGPEDLGVLHRGRGEGGDVGIGRRRRLAAAEGVHLRDAGPVGAQLVTDPRGDPVVPELVEARPADGLVQAQASPTTPESAGASTQCAWSGNPRSTRSKQSGRRSSLSGTSRELPHTVTDQVSLSDGSVRTEIVPCCVRGPERHSGGAPEK